MCRSTGDGWQAMMEATAVRMDVTLQSPAKLNKGAAQAPHSPTHRNGITERVVIGARVPKRLWGKMDYMIMIKFF